MELCSVFFSLLRTDETNGAVLLCSRGYFVFVLKLSYV